MIHTFCGLLILDSKRKTFLAKCIRLYYLLRTALLEVVSFYTTFEMASHVGA